MMVKNNDCIQIANPIPFILDELATPNGNELVDISNNFQRE